MRETAADSGCAGCALIVLAIAVFALFPWLLPLVVAFVPVIAIGFAIYILFFFRPG